MTFTRVSPPDAPPPKGYTPAVSVIAGRLVFLSGQTALDPSGTIRGETVVEQFDRALGNLVQALTAAGGTPDQLVKVTVFCVDPADYRRHSAELGRVWRERAGRDYPAMTLVGVTRLWDEEALVELEGGGPPPPPVPARGDAHGAHLTGRTEAVRGPVLTAPGRPPSMRLIHVCKEL